MDTPCLNSPITILMVHGYGQSGPFFEIKTRPLVRRLTKLLSNHYNTDEKNIRLVFPDGPLHLSSGLEAAAGTSEGRMTIDSDMRAWTPFYSFSDSTQYSGIQETLATLAHLSETQGPFTGVMGFSQGAVMASMFASWCESDYTLGRRTALQEMNSSRENPVLSQILSRPPQGPLDFAILFSGFKGNIDFYSGFYEPRIMTPTIHVLGKYDTFIPRPNSLELVNSCRDALLVEHKGAHFVPRDPPVLEKVAQSLGHILPLSPPKLSPSSSSSASTAGDECVTPGEELTLTLTNLHLSNVDASPLAGEKLHDPFSKLEVCSAAGSEVTNSSSSPSPWRRGLPRNRRIVRRYRLSGTR